MWLNLFAGYVYYLQFLLLPRTKKKGKVLSPSTLFFLYKNLVYRNIKASKCPKIKNIVVILLVAIFISFEGFSQKNDVLIKDKKCTILAERNATVA